MTERVPLLSTEGGIRHDWVQDGDKFQIASVGATDPVIERNKAMATHNDGYTPDRTFRRVASIPLILVLKWLNEEGWNALLPANADRLVRKLNDPDYAYLRTAPGRVALVNGKIR